MRRHPVDRGRSSTWGRVAKVAAATAAFGLLHSALASRAAKGGAARLFGPRQRAGWYRIAFVAQSVATFGALAAYVRPFSGPTLYDVRGPLAWLLRAGQAAGVLYALAAARQVGIRRMVGLDGAAAWFRPGPVPPEAEAQGPAPAADGAMAATGPFAWSRHPLNLAPLPVLWLSPRMTVNLAACAAVSTAYLVVGSLHEEARLGAAYGAAYDAYRRGGVPFYLPSPHGRAGAARRVGGGLPAAGASSRPRASPGDASGGV